MVADFATSEDPAVQRQLDRLARMKLQHGRFDTSVIRALLERLGNPQDRLPPVFHVAGTNGKGSTCAFLRAMLEADGKTVHVSTSPHLVRFNERIRVAGEVISDEALAALLEEVIDASDGLGTSFFEVSTAASLLAFARTPADAAIVEVGLGGRLDATNVFKRPAACGIAALGIDHEEYLLRAEDGLPTSPLARIAFEKAGIVRPGSSLVTLSYPPEAELEIERAAMAAGAPLAMRGTHWHASVTDVLTYADRHGELVLPLPAMRGEHQAENAALAVAMLRHQDYVTVAPEALAKGIRRARWPARLQKLGDGPLTRLAGRSHTVWLDGGHNPSAGQVLATHFSGSEPLHLVLGMLARKDPAAIVGPLRENLATVQVVPVPGDVSHRAEDVCPRAMNRETVEQALEALPDDGLPVLIAGSLYLAGEVLRLNDEMPD
ncbi:folylpolyglutamate synthase/dihydrofolate synthase family protein [Alteriqipengyuania flavescens]|uniref:bifunctional folylpolyglutamate synthase/dihydrofolate synthase n=1 Tax=Alteriqipengyuania flavescens TaxID=3053610 RepID=UPI0025B4B500|nr:folylpolyglutamate synthase/dihydrofolate synthase family protein [Alteriqipengyuania flavescens]WJY18031.1 folylpolyglutamate synthase/dihydrofolate synthase family protein [Alteriqipengyuania flavescens]WJY23972.1 folylpolyglutamate synthase/dihydrofolate synthase family protein [Alteriqipengyuania flavescens]